MRAEYIVDMKISSRRSSFASLRVVAGMLKSCTVRRSRVFDRCSFWIVFMIMSL